MDCIIDDQLWTPETLEGARSLFNWGPPRRRRSCTPRISPGFIPTGSRTRARSPAQTSQEPPIATAATEPASHSRNQNSFGI